MSIELKDKSLNVNLIRQMRPLVIPKQNIASEMPTTTARGKSIEHNKI